MRRLIPTAAALAFSATAWASSPAPAVTIPTGAAHVRDVAVAIMESPAVGKIIQLRVVNATPYSVVFAGPQGTGSALTPSAHAEIDLTLIPHGKSTRLVARSYSVTPGGNVATDAPIRSDTTGHDAKRMLWPLVKAVKHCSATPEPESCPQ